MRGFNKAVFVGNLVRDPEHPSVNAPVKFTLAVGKKYRNRNGDVTEHTDFIPCSAWGKLGDEVVLRYCRKGSPLLVEGEVSTRDFDDPKTGQHRWTWEVNVSGVVLLGSGDGSKREATVSADDEAKRLAGVAQALRSPAAAAQGDGMSLRSDPEFGGGNLFPVDELGFGPHSPEGQDVKIPF